MPETKKNTIELPESYNYIGVFLTFRCNNNCPFCINKSPGNRLGEYEEIPGRKWIDFFARLNTRDVPITLQGGEPGLHHDFHEIVAETLKFHHVDILTTLDFDLEKFAALVPPERINRKAPYAPIRVSYHPTQDSLETIIGRTEFLVNAGFRVGIYGVLYPEQIDEIEEAKNVCAERGLDFRTKEFLGIYKGKTYGKYAYPEACYSQRTRECECAPTELLIAPDGSTHRCHNYLYSRLEPIDSIENQNLILQNEFSPCARFGNCSPCDIKIKTNRFQQYGHVSARIRNIKK